MDGIPTPRNPQNLEKLTGSNTACEVFARKSSVSKHTRDRPLLDRYSTVTRPLLDRYVRYTPRNMQALDILGFWEGVKC